MVATTLPRCVQVSWRINQGFIIQHYFSIFQCKSGDFSLLSRRYSRQIEQIHAAFRQFTAAAVYRGVWTSSVIRYEVQRRWISDQIFILALCVKLFFPNYKEPPGAHRIQLLWTIYRFRFILYRILNNQSRGTRHNTGMTHRHNSNSNQKLETEQNIAERSKCAHAFVKEKGIHLPNDPRSDCPWERWKSPCFFQFLRCTQSISFWGLKFSIL